MGNDPCFGIPILEIPSDQSSSSDSIHIIVHPDHQISEHNSKWTKDHLLENIIGELARPIKAIQESELKGYPNRLEVILKNKDRLVARGYRQEEGIDFEESFAPIVKRIENEAKTVRGTVAVRGGRHVSTSNLENQPKLSDNQLDLHLTVDFHSLLARVNDREVSDNMIGQTNSPQCPCRPVNVRFLPNDEVVLMCNPTPNFFDNSPNFSDPHQQYSTYFCNNCGNNHYDGFDCPSLVQFNFEPKPCNNQDEKRIAKEKEAARQEEEKRIAKEKEAAELEAKRKSQECLNIEEKSIPQASIRSRKSRIDPTLRNFTISTKCIPFSTVKTVNSLKMGDKHLDTQKGSLESSVKDPIPIPRESDVISDDDCDDDYQKRFDLKVQQLWMPSIYDENNKIRECHLIRSSAITPDLPIPDSLIMEDEHLDTIPVTESANTIKSSVEDLVPTPSESADLSDGESECDVPINDDSPESHFSTFDNPLFDSNDDFSSDDESLSEEEIQKDEFKYFSNPLYDLDDEIITNEKILPNQKDLDVVIPIPPGIDERCFNAESDLLESLLNRDSPIDSTKIDSIFDEFSLPRPPEESNSEISDATIESLSPSPILKHNSKIADTIVESLSPPPIPVEDSDSLMEDINLFLASDDSMPSGIELFNDYARRKGDYSVFLKNC
ncbi:hypothetical protein Tco_0079838 [Tanacetum coccineum]